MNDLHGTAAARLRASLAASRFDWLRAARTALPDASWYVVGGSVRDAMRGRGDDADVDLVVRGTPYAALREALETLGRVDLVGRVFGVIKFRPEGAEEEFDIALPRTERAGMSGGYRDFAVQSDPGLPIDADLARRDFTVNAMAYDIDADKVVDPHGGAGDLAAKVLRAVGDPKERFSEDLSRAMRGMRFACQLGFVVEPETELAMIAALRRIADLHPDSGERLVPRETVASEFVKALAVAPSRAVRMLDASGVLVRLIPECSALKGCAQSPDHHSEGDVWTHTLLALDALESGEFSSMFGGDTVDAETVVATLFHDIAKPQTATLRGDRITFYGHAEEGARMARAIVERLGLSSVDGRVDPDRVAWLVQLHLFPVTTQLDTVRKTTLVRHFLVDRPRGRRLLHLAFADAMASIRPDGTPDISHIATLMRALAEIEQAVGDDPKKTLLTGDEVMAEAHLAPGPEIGKLLEALHEAQLQGEVTDHEQAKEFVRKMAE